jgi:hypothetical protein
VTATLLPLPFALRKKGDYCVATKEKEEGNGSVAAITFFIALQEKRLKKVTATLLALPSVL